MTTVAKATRTRGEASMWIMESILEEKNWMIIGISFQESIYATQFRNIKEFGTINKILTEDRESKTVLKFKGKLEPATCIEKIWQKNFFPNNDSIDLWTWIRTILLHWTEQKGCENVWELWDDHYANMIDTFKIRLIAGNPESFDHFELEDITWFHILIESRISKTFRARLQVIFGHLKEYNKGPGSELFMLAFEICHASVALDIEGRTLALVSLSLFSYCKENVTDWVTKAQLMQSGYAHSVQTGSLQGNLLIHPMNISIIKRTTCLLELEKRNTSTGWLFFQGH